MAWAQLHFFSMRRVKVSRETSGDERLNNVLKIVLSKTNTDKGESIRGILLFTVVGSREIGSKAILS